MKIMSTTFETREKLEFLEHKIRFNKSEEIVNAMCDRGTEIEKASPPLCWHSYPP